MKAFGEIFRLEWRSLVRSRALALLLAASVVWMFVMPHLVRSDGTAEGARQLYVQYSLGGVFALAVLSLAVAAAGSLARERAAKRLQLTRVRPVGAFTVAFARTAAFASAGALVLAAAAGVLAARVELARPCDHVLEPVLESPRAEAERMYAIYMGDPETPKAIREAKKSDVIRILTQRAAENYQSIPTNAVEVWEFALPERAEAVSVRLRFTNMYDMREDFFGTFRCGGLEGSVSNVTKAVMHVPLTGPAGARAGGRLEFRNEGAGELMLRPRRDINLLVGAGSFAANLVRAWIELVSLLTLAVAFGVFLGAALGRSTAVFSVVAVLFITVASPAVLEECPYDLDTTRGDRTGLALTRFAGAATRPFSEVSPLGHLAADECVEWTEAFRVVIVDLVVLPLLFALLSAAVVPRKEDGL